MKITSQSKTTRIWSRIEANRTETGQVVESVVPFKNKTKSFVIYF